MVNKNWCRVFLAMLWPIIYRAWLTLSSFQRPMLLFITNIYTIFLILIKLHWLVFALSFALFYSVDVHFPIHVSVFFFSFFFDHNCKGATVGRLENQWLWKETSFGKTITYKNDVPCTYFCKQKNTKDCKPTNMNLITLCFFCASQQQKFCQWFPQSFVKDKHR